MHALISLLAALALLATSAEAKAKPRDAILLSQVRSPPPHQTKGQRTSSRCLIRLPSHAHGRQVIAHDRLADWPDNYSHLVPQVESLTLRADRQTTHRRVPAVPQLKCVSPRGICSKYQIDVLRCENKGSGYDSEDIQWSCTASLPPELKLGSTDVVREKPPTPHPP